MLVSCTEPSRLDRAADPTATGAASGDPWAGPAGSGKPARPEDRSADKDKDDASLERVASEIKALCARFPVYA